MPVTFTFFQIEKFKLHAKSISRSDGISHSAALDQLANENGFSNWSLLMKHAVPVSGNQISSQHPSFHPVQADKTERRTQDIDGGASNVARLVAIGFRQAGRWTLANQVLRLTLEPAIVHEQNVLYAFVVNGVLMYVGKTTQSLIKRMQGYRSPASNSERGGSTNIKNNRNIIDALRAGANVDIYVLHALPIQQHGEFAVNVAAGLEDSIINKLAPSWNGKSLAPAAGPSQAAPIKVSPPATFMAAFAPGTTIPRLVNQPPSALDTYNSGLLPSAETLLVYCNSKRGELMTTIARKNRFRVDVVGTYLEITPGSSEAPRREAKSKIAALLSRLEKTQSFQMSDYQDVTFNASYILAIVKAWQRDIRC